MDDGEPKVRTVTDGGRLKMANEDQLQCGCGCFITVVGVLMFAAWYFIDMGVGNAYLIIISIVVVGVMTMVEAVTKVTRKW